MFPNLRYFTNWHGLHKSNLFADARAASQWLDCMYWVNFFWVNFSEILKHEVHSISGELQ